MIMTWLLPSPTETKGRHQCLFFSLWKAYKNKCWRSRTLTYTPFYWTSFLIYYKVFWKQTCISLTVNVDAFNRRQAECAKTARIQMALPPGGKAPPAGAPTANLYEELGDSSMWVNHDPLLYSSHPHPNPSSPMISRCSILFLRFCNMNSWSRLRRSAFWLNSSTTTTIRSSTCQTKTCPYSCRQISRLISGSPLWSRTVQ